MCVCVCVCVCVCGGKSVLNFNLCDVFAAADAEQQYSEEDGWEFVTLADQVCALCRHYMCVVCCVYVYACGRGCLHVYVSVLCLCELHCVPFCHVRLLVHAQQKFGIKTAGLDDKCTAMQMLTVYAKDLKDGFANYAEQVRVTCATHEIRQWGVPRTLGFLQQLFKQQVCGEVSCCGVVLYHIRGPCFICV